MLIRIRKAWETRGLEPTPEDDYWNRRNFLKAAGLGGLAFGATMLSGFHAPVVGNSPSKPYPAQRNAKYKLDRQLTDEEVATSYNNFYEFAFDKRRPKRLAQRMVTSPWNVKIGGLVERPVTLDVDDLIHRFPLEERLYRFRCVEAWAMAVPWTGFPLKKLLEYVKPSSDAKFVRFVTFLNRQWGPGFSDTGYPWPYHEGLTIEEATNDLTLLVTGLYGKPLPKQNGAPVRVIVPWKYGFKSIKSIVEIQVLKERPKTFWNTVIPHEYDFQANVNPKVPHPRWSQAQETLIGSGERVPTQLYNGYQDSVAGLYK